jgi:hypothetical protein
MDSTGRQPTMRCSATLESSGHGRIRRSLPSLLLAGVCLLPAVGPAGQGTGAAAQPAQAPPSLEVTRLTMGKWIETQQIIARERKGWQQDKEVLQGRLELIKKELQTIDEKTRQAAASVAEAETRRKALLAEALEVKAAGARLTEAVTAMEAEVRRLFKMAPEPVQTLIQPLFQRIPEDPAKTRVTTAERFQNVLFVLSGLNKANNEITTSYEVHTLASGKSAEVQTLYVGLAQAWYVSAQGESGIGRPSPDGWQWTPDNRIAREVLNALEIQQGKQSPAFVPLPVKIQ